VTFLSYYYCNNNKQIISEKKILSNINPKEISQKILAMLILCSSHSSFLPHHHSCGFECFGHALSMSMNGLAEPPHSWAKWEIPPEIRLKIM
jgi:hypothetical protein